MYNTTPFQSIFGYQNPTKKKKMGCSLAPKKELQKAKIGPAGGHVTPDLAFGHVGRGGSSPEIQTAEILGPGDARYSYGAGAPVLPVGAWDGDELGRCSGDFL